MNSRPFAKNQSRGSALIVVIVFLTILTTALAAILGYSSNTHRNSSRQEIFDQARMIADSEMEYLYYVWKQQSLLGTLGTGTTAALQAAGYFATGGYPFSANTKAQGLILAPATGGWNIDRIIEFKAIPGRPDGGASGQVPGTQKLGHNFYFEARVTVRLTHAIFGKLEYNVARRFVQTETSLFQNAIYYQDDLEVAALGRLIVNGDITCNGDVYFGAQPTSPTHDLIIYGKAKIFGKLNGLTIGSPYDGSIGTVMRKPGSLGTSTLHDPIFDPSAGISPPSDQVATRVTQVQKLDVPENVLGGVDAETVKLGTYYRAYRDNPGSLTPFDFAADPEADDLTAVNPPTANNVYRSVIAPLPTEADGITSIPEDPIIQSRRMHVRAGIVVTLTKNTSGTGPATLMQIGNAASPNAYTSTTETIMTTVIPEAERRQPLTDAREGQVVQVTNIYIDKLKAAVDAGGNDIATNFNGVIYVYDNTNDGSLSAIRLKNATATPVITDINDQLKGFTVVSNNGIYIQGNFNTVALPSKPGHFNPCAIMGDAITVLSQGFVDTTGATALSTRLATDDITINSALISGNTPSGVNTTSGGVQNLVRYLEDWTAGGHSATFHGSLSQLFQSRYFKSVYKPNGSAGNVYTNPTPRVFDFDVDLADTPPALSPKSSSYFRGEHYTF